MSSAIKRRPEPPLLQNFQALDALRGLLAVYVVAGHARWLLWTGHANWVAHPHGAIADGLAYASASLRFGHEAVMVFFALSGFFIHMRMAQKPDRNLDVPDYARRRAHRIVPPYLFALAVTLVIDAVGRHSFPMLYLGQTNDPMLNRLFLSKTFSMSAVLPALACVPSALGEDFGSNGPLWSIGYEMIYYCLYPLWLWTRRTSAVLAYLLIPAALLSAASLIPASYFAAVLQKYPIWIAGAGLAEVAVNQHLRRGSTLLCFTLLIFGIGLATAHRGFVHIGIGISVVALFGSLPRRLCDWKACRLFEYIGVRSYSLYACHFPVLVLISAWLFASRGSRPSDALMAVFGTFLCVIFGLFCFGLCERRFLHRRIATAPSIKLTPENA